MTIRSQHPRPLSRFFLVGSALFVAVAAVFVVLDYRRVVPWLLLLVSLSNFMTAWLLRRSPRSAATAPDPAPAEPSSSRGPPHVG